MDNGIDEIYCSMCDFNHNQINDFIDFSDNNLKVLKFIPDSKEFFTQNLKLNYYLSHDCFHFVQTVLILVCLHIHSLISQYPSLSLTP